MKKPAIGSVPRAGQPREGFDSSVKEVLEVITGRRVAKIEKLPDTATTADLIAKVNELLDRIQ